MNTPNTSDRFFGQSGPDAALRPSASPVRHRRPAFVRRIRPAVVFAVVAALAVAGLLFWGLFTANAASDGYTYFPSASTTDGKMLRIAGDTLGTLSGTTVTVSFSVPATQATFIVSFFDGRSGNGNAVNGQWDQTNAAFETRYNLYADPGGQGAGTTLVASWVGASMAWNAWSDFSVTNTSTALAPSGRCFYHMTATAVDASIAAGNCFKIRVAGTSYITPTKTFGYYGSPNPSMTDSPTYTGDWDFYVRVPQGLTHFDMWDGDFDLTDDTDDPNTTSTPPTWSTTAALPEQARAGNPADDNVGTPGWMRSPNINYDVFLPDGSRYNNADPSGDTEWELFRLSTESSATTMTDYYVPAIPAGLWRVHLYGVDQHNLNALRFEQPVLGVDASGTPVEPDFPYALGDRVWLDGNRNRLQDSGETSITGVMLTLRDGAGSFIATASTDASGAYRFTALPGTYTVDVADPSNYVSGGPLAGLMATTARTLTSVVTTNNNLTIDFGLARGPALVVTKALAASSSTTAAVGEDTTYTVTVRNVGETTATSIVVTDTIVGADMAYVAGSTAATYTGGTSSANPTSPTASTLRWDFGPSSKIASGAVLTLTYRVRVKPGATWGAHPDTVAVAATDASGTPIAPDGHTWIAADTDPDDMAGATVWVTVPELRITKTRTSADTTIQAGQPATFMIVVRNVGDSRVATVPVTDTFPNANLTYTTASPAPSGVAGGSLSWTNVGALNPGQQTTLTVSFVASAAPAGNTAVDTAAAGPALDVFGRAVPAVSATASVAVTRPHLSVTKSLSSPDAAIQAGQGATFTVVVRNDGDTRVGSVSLTDLYQNAYLTFTTSTPGPALLTSSLTTYAVNASDTAGQWSNDANSLGATTGTVASSNNPPFDMWHSFAAPAGMASVDGATITVRSQASGGWGAANPAIPVVLTRSPTGDIAVGQWTIGGTTPAPTRWQSVDDPPGSPDEDVTDVYPAGGNEYQASIGALAVPAGATNIAVTATMRIRDSGAQGSATLIRWRQNGTWRSGANRDPGAAYTTYSDTLANPAGGAWTAAAVNLIDGIGLDNSDRNPVPYVTQLYLTVTYDLPQPPNDDTWAIQYSTDAGSSWSNITAASTASEGSLLDHVLNLTGILTPANVSGFRVRVSGSVVGSADGTGTASWDTSKLDLTYKTPPSNGSLSWAALGALDPGQQTTVTVSFVASASPAGLSTVDTATTGATTDINGDAVPSAAGSAAVAVTRPAIAISKTLAPSQPATVGIGAPVRFQVLVTNTGNTTITAASVVDTWSPAYLDYVSAVPTAAAVGSGTATWTALPPIAPGKVATLTITYSALAPPPGGVTLNRVHTASVTDLNGDPAGDVAASATVNIANTRVSVTKTRTSPDPVIQVGQVATYTVVVRNTGVTALTTVPLTDLFEDACLDYSSAAPVPNATATSSVTWNNVGPLAPGQQTTITIGLRATAPTSGRSTIDTATVIGATDSAGVVAGSVTATASVIVRWSAVITALSASDAPQTGTDVAVTSSVRNDLALPIANSTMTYVMWWDDDGNGVFNAGDTYIDAAGNPHTWDGSTSVSTHVTSGVSVAATGTWTEPSPWTVNNRFFPRQGTYNVTATWRESNGTLIDVKTTQFYSIPALGWPLFALTVLAGTAFMWFRLPALALLTKRMRGGAR